MASGESEPQTSATTSETSALSALRLRTPNLELRLPSAQEILDLYAVAAAGIHPPETMPFYVAWTDRLSKASFVAYHQGCLEEWLPSRWEAPFVAFLDGRPIGVQSLSATDFARRREVRTGSWLGAAWQGRGFGTEQRAGVLAFAFDHLGARVARSGAVWDNLASQGVSRKLGYRQVGESTASPRGQPVRHLDYRLEARGWKPPFTIEVLGSEEALPLFGV